MFESARPEPANPIGSRVGSLLIEVPPVEAVNQLSEDEEIVYVIMISALNTAKSPVPLSSSSSPKIRLNVAADV